MNKLLLLLVATYAVVGAGFTGAAPVAEKDRLAIDLRRTTLVVSNTENSLRFYRDSLGMEVIYDKFINNPRDASLENADISRRLVFLRANDDYIGIIGLLEYVKPRKPRVDLTGTAFNEGTAVLVFNSSGLEQTIARAREVPGTLILKEPSIVEYPAYDGAGTISVKVSVLQDPDGFTVELNQLQEDLH